MESAVAAIVLILFVIGIIYTLSIINKEPDKFDPFVVHHYIVTDRITGKQSFHSIIIRESQRNKILEQKRKE